MRIVFLCGSLEPGHDGVGDYTRKLAGELLRQNHQAAIIALHDRHLKQGVLESIQQNEQQSIPTLRLSSQLPWKDRINESAQFIQSINPDWVSLQYVPFSFQIKGLPFGLSGIVKRITRGKKVHIMFHELWLGMSVQSPKRHIVWGRIQRFLIHSLISRLKPRVIHTQTALYQIHLQKLGIDTALLPLFANIPTNCFDSKPIFSKTLRRIAFVFFGGIYPGTPVGQLAKEAAQYATQKKINIDLTLIGRNGVEQETWASAWKKEGLDVKILGEHTPEYISEILSQSSVGLSTTPVALSGKSGSIAAMHAHGLPVLCVSEPWQPRGVDTLKTPPGILEYSIGNFEACIDTKESRLPITTDVANVAYQLVTSLSANSIPS